MADNTAPAATAGSPPIPFVPGLDGVPAAKSSICWIDGDQGILEYRGYPIEDLAERSTFEETSYMLLWDKLPNRAELEKFTRDLQTNRDVRPSWSAACQRPFTKARGATCRSTGSVTAPLRQARHNQTRP